ncbi:MAG: lasso peptide biosynthesis B2 protein [Sphingopyxis sp.]
MTWRIRQRAKTFAQMGLRRHALLAEATAMLLVARIWLLATPFSRIATKLGRLSDAGANDCIERTSQQLDTAKAIGEAVRLAARLVPVRSLCLQQAVAAKLMLRRRGIMGTLHFGVVIDDDGARSIQSHAWLNVDCVRLTGFPVPQRYTEVGQFN